jgi:hypothetical protein
MSIDNDFSVPTDLKDIEAYLNEQSNQTESILNQTLRSISIFSKLYELCHLSANTVHYYSYDWYNSSCLSNTQDKLTSNSIRSLEMKNNVAPQLCSCEVHCCR